MYISTKQKPFALLWLARDDIKTYLKSFEFYPTVLSRVTECMKHITTMKMTLQYKHCFVNFDIGWACLTISKKNQIYFMIVNDMI